MQAIKGCFPSPPVARTIGFSIYGIAMNLQQLRILREAVRADFNLTEVASRLFTAQSGVSKHIKDLEDELGVALFVRKGKRLLDLTEPGRDILPLVERILLDTHNIQRVAEQCGSKDEGRLAVGTTHTQARYALPGVISRFTQRFPDVHLELHQCSPTELTALLHDGRVDIGIATEGLRHEAGLVSFPYYRWRHAVIVPRGHPLAQLPAPTLADVAGYPLITYHSGYTGRASIDAAFACMGLRPRIVMSALDADVIKSYVEIGLGIGIVASMAYHPERDSGLEILPGDDWFETNTTWISLRRGHYLRDFALEFIAMCSPSLEPRTVRDAVFPPPA